MMGVSHTSMLRQLQRCEAAAFLSHTRVFIISTPEAPLHKRLDHPVLKVRESISPSQLEEGEVTESTAVFDGSACPGIITTKCCCVLENFYLQRDTKEVMLSV